MSLLDTYVYNRKQRKRDTLCNFYFFCSGGSICSTLQNSSKLPTRCEIFEKRASQTACSGRGFCFSSFLNSTRWQTWSGLINRSSGIPLQPFFSSLQHTHPFARACALHLRSSSSSSCFIVSSFRSPIRTLSCFETLARGRIVETRTASSACTIRVRAMLAINLERFAPVVKAVRIPFPFRTLSASVPAPGVHRAFRFSLCHNCLVLLFG